MIPACTVTVLFSASVCNNYIRRTLSRGRPETHLQDGPHTVHANHPLISTRQIARTMAHASRPQRFALPPCPFSDQTAFVYRRRYESLLRVTPEGTCPVEKCRFWRRGWHDARRQKAGEAVRGDGGGMRAFGYESHYSTMSTLLYRGASVRLI